MELSIMTTMWQLSGRPNQPYCKTGVASGRPEGAGWLAGGKPPTARRPNGAKLIILVYDSFVAGFSLLLAYLLRSGPPPQEALRDLLVFGPALFGSVAAVVFAALGLHHAVWRHASTGDIVRIVKAATAAIPVYLLLMFLLGRLDSIPRSVPLIQWSLLVVVLGASRLTWRLIYEQIRRRRVCPATKPLIIVGSGDECSLLLREISSGAATPYRPVGIIDLAGRDIGRRIQGIPVLGRASELSEIVSRMKKGGEAPATIVFAEDVGQSVRDLISRAEGLGLEAVRMPNIVKFRAALSDGRVEFEPLPLHALIGREQMQLDQGPIQRFIGGNKVLITGAGGSIGSELVRLIAKSHPAQIILLDQCEYNLYAIDQELRDSGVDTPTRTCLADIRNRACLRTIFEGVRPDLVFHAAALKHVPMVELNPVEGVLTNIIGTCNVADEASAVGVRAMVHISTDKAVNPSSVMGATKRVAEFYCQAFDTADWQGMVESRRPRFFTVRFGNVIGSSGSVVPLFQKQLSQGGPLTVTHSEMRRYFMTIREAAQLVLRASASEAGSGGERGIIFVLDMGKPVRIADVARRVIHLAGKEPGRDIEIRIVGMRPGEKLVEELFDHHEERLPANVEGVFAARSQSIELSVLRKTIAELACLCACQDNIGVRLALQSLVPGYALDVKAWEAA